MLTTNIKPFEIKPGCTGHALRQSWSAYISKNTRKKCTSSADVFWINLPQWIEALDSNNITNDDFRYCILEGPFYENRLSGILGVLGRLCADRNIFPDFTHTVFNEFSHMNAPIKETKLSSAISQNPLSGIRLMQHATGLFDDKNDYELGEPISKSLISANTKDLTLFLDKIKYKDTQNFRQFLATNTHHTQALYVHKHYCVNELKYLVENKNLNTSKLSLINIYNSYNTSKSIFTEQEQMDFKFNLVDLYSIYFNSCNVDASTILNYINAPLAERNKLDISQIICLNSLEVDYPEHKNLIALSRSLDSIEPLRSLQTPITDQAVALPELCL